jgi:Coenzyme PQQ synthesis protein D (PqqD)
MGHRHRQDLVSRVVDEELLILDREAGRVHRFNPTATYIWNTCNGLSASEIAVRMAQEFDVAPEMALADIKMTLLDFRRLGLVLDVCSEATEPTE